VTGLTPANGKKAKWRQGAGALVVAPRDGRFQPRVTTLRRREARVGMPVAPTR